MGRRPKDKTPEETLRRLSGSPEKATSRYQARQICAFFGLPVPDWARKRPTVPTERRIGIRANTKAEYQAEYYLAVTKPKRRRMRHGQGR